MKTMTPDEFRQALEGLSDEGYRKFVDAVGDHGKSKQVRVDEFGENPSSEKEARFAYLLGLQTEEAKRTEAAIESSRAALESAEAAREASRIAESSRRIALWALLATAILATVAFLKYLEDSSAVEQLLPDSPKATKLKSHAE